MEKRKKSSRLEIFAKRLTEAREANGLKKSRLAELLNISEPNITRYENAEHGAREDQIEKMSEILGVSPAWLLGYDVPKYIEASPCKAIPIIGDVAAGLPLFAQENILGYEAVEENECIDFCLKIKGDSMINAGIPDGSLVFIKRQDTFDNGQVVICLIDNEAVCKRAYKENGKLELRSDNPTYPPILIKKKDVKDVRILGVVKYVKHKVY